MEQVNKSLNPLNIAKIFAFLWLFSLFFPIRYIFPTHFSYQTGLFSDFTSVPLYLSDILLFTTWVFILPRGKIFLHVVKPLKSLIFWAILIFFLTFDHNWAFSLFFLGKLTEIIVAYGTISVLFQETDIKTSFLSIFTGLGGVQSLLAINQFLIQHPVGLFKLGEQQIFPNAWGVAKVIVEGTAYIRGYGTFPHPNVLSAFLIASIFIGIYLFNKSQKLWTKALLGSLILINILGLTVTFSRAAFLAFGIGLVSYGVFSFFLRRGDREADQVVGKKEDMIAISSLVAIGIILSIIFFHKFLLARATISDQAIADRGLYNHIALNIIKTHPLFGVGLGESVLHMQQFSNIKLWPWQIQPIHNYFLLSAAELGIPGALIFIWIFLYHLKTIIYKLKTNFDSYLLTLTSIFVAFLVLMFFDHYFYTLQQTQFLLWIILGIIAAETQTKNPQTGD